MLRRKRPRGHKPQKSARPLLSGKEKVMADIKIRVCFLAAPAERVSLWPFRPPVVLEKCKWRLMRCQIQWGIVPSGSKSCRAAKGTGNLTDLPTWSGGRS